MARQATNGPTEGELAILRVLWDKGSASVREVNQALNETKRTGYTTTLKLMQIMLGKGLLSRDDSVRPQVYSPALSKDRTERQMVGDLLERVFDGSASQFVMQILAAKKASPKELAEIRRILAKANSKKEGKR